MLKLFSALFNILLYILAGILIVFLLPRTIMFFMPFLIAWMIAIIANPLVTWLEKRISLRRKHGSAIIVIGVLIVLTTLMYIAISRLIILGRFAVNQMPMIIGSISSSISLFLNKLRGLSDLLPNSYRDNAVLMLGKLSETLNSALSGIAIPTFGFAGEIVKSLPSMLVYFVITWVSAYLFIAKREAIYLFVDRHTPDYLKKYRDRFSKDLKHTLVGYFIAQMKISLIVMAVMAVGFWILGVKYAIWIAVAIGIFDYLPVLGAGAILIPWTILDFLNGEVVGGIGMLLIYLATQLLRQMLQPKLVGDSIGMPSMLTLICLFLGFRVAGFGGMIIAIPIGMLVMKLYEYGIFDSLFASVNTIIRIASEFREKGLH